MDVIIVGIVGITNATDIGIEIDGDLEDRFE